ncbi:hypothetical protein [Aquabacterium sp.]|uniref:hypothetical protein n=1 Tax=Aquabacterium sp. TaxID=1872578 RepID=UPI0035ADD7BB
MQLMKKIVLAKLKYFCALIALCVVQVGVRAEIVLDDNFPWTEQEVGFGLAGVHNFEAAINRDQVAQGFEAKDYYETINFFRMLWNDKVYYVAGAQIVSREQNAARDAALARSKRSVPIPGGGVCALFVYDKDLKQVAKHEVKLNEANGHTWCNGARALARVKGQDALLFSISYYLTDKPVATKSQDIGGGWRYMTVLLRLREREGRVLIEQDDACLGNPNKIQDLSSARKALVACN